MYLLDKLTGQIKDLSDLAQKFKVLHEWIEINAEKFSDLPEANCVCGSIDFDNLAHDQVMQVVMRFGGRWKREGVEDRINYSMEAATGVVIRCYKGQPPPNCKIEYEEVKIPARTERRAKMVCQPVTHALPIAEPVMIEAVPVLGIEEEIPF